MTRAEQARQYFLEGYNCAQAVAMAFADITPLTSEQMAAAASAFGGGFSRTRNLCGAVSAMGLIAGMAVPHDADLSKDKKDVYAKVNSLCDSFKCQHGSLNCAELLKNVKNVTQGIQPQQRTDKYYKERPCAAYVMSAANILEDYLKQEGIIK